MNPLCMVSLMIVLVSAEQTITRREQTISLRTGEQVMIDSSLNYVSCSICSPGVPFQLINGPFATVYKSDQILGLYGGYGIRNVAPWGVTSTIRVTCH